MALTRLPMKCSLLREGPLSLEQGNLSPKGLSLDTTYDKCQNANGAFCKPGDADD